MPDVIQQVVGVAAKLFLPLFSLGLGLALAPASLWAALRRPVIPRALAVGLIGVPLLAIVVVRLVPAGPIAGGLILLMAVSPGLPLLVKAAGEDAPGERAGARAATATAVAIVLTLAGALWLPVALRVLSGLFAYELRVSPGDALRAVLVAAILPFVAGLGLRAASPGLAERLRPIVAIVFKISALALVVVVLAASATTLQRLRPAGLVAMALVALGSVALGHLAGGGDRMDREVLATAAVYGNPSLAAVVIATSYPDLAILGPMSLYLVLRTLLFMAYQRWARRTRHPKAGRRAHAAGGSTR